MLTPIDYSKVFDTSPFNNIIVRFRVGLLILSRYLISVILCTALTQWEPARFLQGYSGESKFG